MDDGIAQGKYNVVCLVFIYPDPSHHPLRALFSAISSKAYWPCSTNTDNMVSTGQGTTHPFSSDVVDKLDMNIGDFNAIVYRFVG